MTGNREKREVALILFTFVEHLSRYARPLLSITRASIEGEKE